MLLSTSHEYASNVESGPLAEEATESKGATVLNCMQSDFLLQNSVPSYLAIAIYGEALNLIGAMAPYFCRL